MRCFWNHTLDNTTNLFKLCHKIVFILQTTRRINHKDVNSLSKGLFHTIINHGSWVSLLSTSHYWHINTTSPLNQLSNRSCTESIGSYQHDFFAFLFVFMRQLTDRRCLTNPVDTNEKHDCQTILEINLLLVDIILLVDVHKFFDNQALQILCFFDIFKTSFVAQVFR